MPTYGYDGGVNVVQPMVLYNKQKYTLLYSPFLHLENFWNGFLLAYLAVDDRVYFHFNIKSLKIGFPELLLPFKGQALKKKVLYKNEVQNIRTFFMNMPSIPF